MYDRVAKRGRPKLPKVPKLSCLRKTSDLNSDGLMYDNTVWHKNADSFRGLKADPKHHKKKVVLFGKDSAENKRWRTHNDIVLSMADKNSILRNEWINDSIINASQTLLQRQYPNIKGLNNVLLFEIDANNQIDWKKVMVTQKEIKRLMEINKNAVKNIELFQKRVRNAEKEEDLKSAQKQLETNQDINRECMKQLSQLRKNEIKVEGLQPLENDSKFVQILLDRTVNRSHWICVSNVKTNHFKTVRIYDNDLQRIHYTIENYSVSIKNTLKRLYYDSDDIRIELPFVSQCDDQCSGGVFAIAFAQALCVGLDPSDILFSGSTKQMRSHLCLCLERATFDRFPTGKESKLKSCDIYRQFINSSKDENKKTKT